MANMSYFFFPDYGLLAYDANGKELWRKPLGPFNNIYGMGASPIIVDDVVVLNCDQSIGSFIAAFRQVDRTRAMAHRARRSAQRSLDAGRLHSARRPAADRGPGIVSAVGLRSARRQAALVGRRPVVRVEVDAGDQRRHALHQWLWIAGESAWREDYRSRRPRRCLPTHDAEQGRQADRGELPTAHAKRLAAVLRSQWRQDDRSR